MKKVGIVGSFDFSGTTLFTHTTDNSTSGEVIINEATTVVCEIKNYKVDPLFVPNNKVRSKYKRNLKYRQW